MAGSGLIALLDDVASIADDLAALADDMATMADDVSSMTADATSKTTGLVTDDLAVTAEQTLGMAGDRELPVVWKIAKGSFFNKFVFLAPGALGLAAVAPWAIHPILMCGGLFLSFEGVEKLAHRFLPHDDHHGEARAKAVVVDPKAFEERRVKGAIRTDLILSAEIVALTLGEVTEAPFMTQVAVLYAVSTIVTVGVYGLVAGLVKLDDLGAWLVLRGGSWRGLGRFIVKAAPRLLHAISWIGTFAMLMVGGHILLEGIHPLEHFVHELLHDLHGPAAFLLGTLADMAVGAVFGAVLVGIMMTGIPAKAWKAVRKD